MRRLVLPTLLLILAACDREGSTVKVDTDNGSFALDVGGAAAGEENGSVSIRSEDGRLALKLPGVDAKIDVPDLSIGSGDMDLDGMKLHPGTKLAGMAIDGNAAGGTVRMRFTDPAAPAAVTAHYVAQAPTAGYALDASGPGRVAGHKQDGAKTSRFEIVVRPAATGSEGTIAVTGD